MNDVVDNVNDKTEEVNVLKNKLDDNIDKYNPKNIEN